MDEETKKRIDLLGFQLNQQKDLITALTNKLSYLSVTLENRVKALESEIVGK